jgi:hypothetical protein
MVAATPATIPPRPPSVSPRACNKPRAAPAPLGIHYSHASTSLATVFHCTPFGKEESTRR